MLFDILLILIPRVTVSDPYAPKTEKQVSFQQAFVLVMRHGPYLTLTAAFLFITVAIQVNLLAEHFSVMTLGLTVNGALTAWENCWRSMMI